VCSPSRVECCPEPFLWVLMFPDSPAFSSFLPSQVHQLTESTSIALARQIQVQSLSLDPAEQAIRTSYVQQGQGGTPILLLHGFDSSVMEFRRLLPPLASRHETWALDMLGFGFTERRGDIPYSPDAIRKHLYRFWETLIQRPMILVGASMGGAAVLDFALTYPECVEKVVLMDSAGFTNGVPLIARYLFPPFDRLAVEFLKSPKLRQQVSALSYVNKSLASEDALLCGSLHVHQQGWQQAIIKFMKSGGYPYLGDKIKQLSQSVLILWGEKDQILNPQEAYKFEERLPNSQLIWVPESGHVSHLEKPALVAEKILQFT
jgi:pimeloyl-ACP methyl ester carboxylesterase